MTESLHLGIIGDVHANARALRAALAHLRAEPFDQLVFLGDLLSYGPDVDEVLDLVSAEVASGALLTMGNHDLLYRDLLGGQRDYRDGLPPWIQETVDWTLDQLATRDPARLLALPFAPSLRLGPLHLSHANPFPPRPGGRPDWRYLDRVEEVERAAAVLRAGGAWAGVFGHTHRPRIVEWPSGQGLGDDEVRRLDGWAPQGPNEALIVNAGAIGQPRSASARATVVRITLAEQLSVSVETLTYDVAGHLDALAALPLSESARQRLTQFFRPRPPTAATPG